MFGYENVKGESGVKLDGKGRESESCEEKRVDFIKRNIEVRLFVVCLSFS